MAKQISLVLDLQILAGDSKVSVAELARKALIVASKLGLDDFKKWVQLELRSYENDDVPSYRVIHCEIKAFNPYHGWTPVVVPNKKIAHGLTTVPIKQSVGELESILRKAGEAELPVPFSSPVTAFLLKGLNVDLVPERFIAQNHVFAILDAVRNTILEWTLTLEQEGILGEGITFSEEEKEKAKTTDRIHIEQFHGILGNVQAQNVQVGDYASILNQLKEAGVSQQERNELENILDELETAKGEKRKSIVQRGLDWVNRNSALIGSISRLITGWVQRGGNGGA